MKTKIELPINPSDETRYELLLKTLIKECRPNDLNNILNLLSLKDNVLNYSESGKWKGIKVGIIGGGLAGMSAAFELRKLGVDLTVLDALEDRVGGRVYTYYFDSSKKVFGELGPLRIPVSHEATWHYINLFKLNTIPFIQNSSNELIYVSETRVKNNPEDIQEKIYPNYPLTEEEIYTPWTTLVNCAINANLYSLSTEERTQTLRIQKLYSPSYSHLTKKSLYENYLSLSLSRGAIDMIDSINSLEGSLYNLSYDEIMSPSYSAAFTAPLYSIEGGNVNLALAFYNSLLSNTPDEYGKIPHDKLGSVTWKKGAWVSSIKKVPSGVSLDYTISNGIDSECHSETFDYVICAIPFSILSSLNISPFFSNIKMAAIRNMNYINSHRTLFLCSEKFWEDLGSGPIIGGNSNTDLVINNIVYPTPSPDSNSANDAGVLVASYNLNKRSSQIGIQNSPTQVELIQNQLEQVHNLPHGYLKNIVRKSVSINWSYESNFRGAFCILSPYQKLLYAYNSRLPEYDGHIFFAGEHLSTTHGWMQGALYTGNQAACQLASHLC